MTKQERRMRAALRASRKLVQGDLDDLLESFTVGGSIGRQKGHPPDPEAAIFAKPYIALLKQIDAALNSNKGRQS